MASIIAENKGFTRELIEPGNYIARAYSMVEIGTVTDTVMGRPTTAKKVRISWELPTELKTFDPAKGEQPLSVSKEFTLSMNPKANLRKTLASWRGKDFTEEEATAFDITKLLGACCFINIIHKPGVADPTKTYEVIASITPLPKGTKCPTAINPQFVLSYNDWDKTKFDSLPDFIRNRMMSSAEFQKILRPEETQVTDEEAQQAIDDGLPF